MGWNKRSVAWAAGVIAGEESFGLKLSFDLDGTGEMQRFWKRFDQKIRRRVTRKAVNAACRPIVKKVRSLAPKKTGLLRRSITHVVRNYRRGGSYAGVIGQRGQRSGATKALAKAQGRVAMGATRHGGISGAGKIVPIHLVNSRVKPHKITANLLKDERLVFKRYGRINWEKRVDHRGHPGDRFMNRAWSQTHKLALVAFEVKFHNEIANEAHKLEWITESGKDRMSQKMMTGG